MAVRWRWVLVLAALAAPGCLGWFTGEGSAADSAGGGGAPPCSTARVLTYEQVSSLGYSAGDLVRSLGGQLDASLAVPAAEFWTALGVDPAPAAPVAVTVVIAYSAGNVIGNECSGTLTVPVVVTLQVGDVLQRTTLASLQGNRQRAELTVDLAPPPAGDGSPQTVTLEVVIDPAEVHGAITAGSGTAGFDGLR